MKDRFKLQTMQSIAYNTVAITQGREVKKKREGKRLKGNVLSFVMKKILKSKSKKTQLKKFFKLFIVLNNVIHHKYKNAMLFL